MSTLRQSILGALATTAGGAIAAGALTLASSWTLRRALDSAAGRASKVITETTGLPIELSEKAETRVTTGAMLASAAVAALIYAFFTYRGAGPRWFRLARPVWRKMYYTFTMALPMGLTVGYVAYSDLDLDLTPAAIAGLVSIIATRLFLERSSPFSNAFEPTGLVAATGGWWDGPV